MRTSGKGTTGKRTTGGKGTASRGAAGPTGQRPVHRREKVAAARAAQAAKERRRRRVVVAAAVVGVLLLAGLIGIVVQTSRDSGGPVVVPATATGDDNGIVVGNAAAPVTLDIYEDFQCPICGQFEAASGSTVAKLIDEGKVKAVYHVLSILGSESERAANAAAAAANDGKFAAYHKVLFANQPEEHSGGYTNETLVDLGRQAGVTSQGFVDAVDAGTYAGYVHEVNETASKRGVNGTPTVFLNGGRLSGEALLPQGLTAAVEAAS